MLHGMVCLLLPLFCMASSSLQPNLVCWSHVEQNELQTGMGDFCSFFLLKNFLNKR